MERGADRRQGDRSHCAAPGDRAAIRSAAVRPPYSCGIEDNPVRRNITITRRPDWKMMRLRDLFSNDATIDPQAEAVVVTGLAVDSRAVKPGEVFFALAGPKTDGARFIDSAIASGAAAIAGHHPPQGVSRVPFVTTPNPRRALALAAANFYPRQPATLAAVTGTSGKTSVAAFTRQIWQRLGHAAASIGTIGLVSPKRTIYGSLTTPDPIALHRQLDEIAGEGVTHLAFEASSHGLDQYRLDGVRIAAGGFTNLTRDHMDYHPDGAHYLAAKLPLFRDLVAAGGPSLICVDSAHKPDALANALQALRPYAKRKLVVVFGAGGDRDAGKRPLMGAIATEYADRVIVTDDNPRRENPDLIRSAILSAARGAKEIGDRAEAIRTAIAGLQPGDALLIAGKGHETTDRR